MKISSRFLVFGLLLFSFVGQAYAISDQKTLVVGVLADFQPQYLHKPNGEPGGFAVDSFDQIALRAGIDYRYRFLENWDQMLTSLRIGEIDIIPNLGVTPERLKLFAFSQTIEQFDLGLFVPAAIDGVANIEAMSGKRVAVVKRNAGVKLLKRYPSIESREYKYVEQALFALLAGDVDGFIYPIPVVNGLLKRHKLEDKIKQTGSSVLRVSRSLAVRKDQKALLDLRLNKSVADFVESPEYQSIYLRWHEEGDFSQSEPSESNGLLSAEDISLILIFVAVAAALLLYFRQAPGIRGLLPADASKAAIVLLLMVIVLVLVVSTVITEPQDNLKPIPKIAVVHLSKVDSSTYAGFLVKMKELGYIQGRNIEYIYKGVAGSIDRLDGLIGEHLAMDPDLVLVSSTPGTLAVKRLTEGTGIPIVFAPVNDPLDAGIVTNLQHPEGLITGVRLPTGDDLRLQWLGQIAPNVHKIYVPYTDGDRSAMATIRQIKKVAPQLGLELVIRPLTNDEEIFGDGSLAKEVDAIFLPRDSTIEARINEFVALANRYQLPLSAPSEKQVVSGALFTFGFVHYEIGRQAGQLVDQILRDTPPAKLPVLMAENYLLINLKAARQIGLTIPSGVLRQANRLIRE